MEKYRFTVIETLSRTVEIDAESLGEAREKVGNLVFDGGLNMSPDDLDNIEIYETE